MKANELRIGNLISLTDTYHQDDVRYVTANTIHAISEGFEMFGIPLTPEILERLGFVLNHVDQLSIVLNSMDRHLELNAVVQGNYFFSINQMEEFGHPSCITLNYIQHLHQLQNLYFALTNEELTLK